MRKSFLLLGCLFLFNYGFGQDKVAAEKLVDEGIAYHDKGDYDGALARYDAALLQDKDNFLALAEKAMTLLSLERNEEAVKVCEKILDVHKDHKSLAGVYVTYGNAYDGLKKTDKSIEIYNEGIKHFPDYYQLYFNKGVTLSSVKKNDEAISCFQQSATLNPKHPGSQNALGKLLALNQKRIPALLAYNRFLILEPKSKRANDNLKAMLILMNGNVEKTGKNSVSISLDPSVMGDTTADGKPNENSFMTTDLILTFNSAMDFDKKNKKKSEVELFIGKFETICVSLKESQPDNYGFYWDYYVPYFVEMNDKKFVETFAYIAFASSDDPDVAKWLKSHDAEIKSFYDWSKNFKWKVN